MMGMDLLRSFMAKHGDRQSDLANVLGISQSALSSRMRGRVDFRLREVTTIWKRYSMTDTELMSVFFAQ